MESAILNVISGRIRDIISNLAQFTSVQSALSLFHEIWQLTDFYLCDDFDFVYYSHS